MDAWYEQAEQSAGTLRIGVLWLVYRLLGKNVQKLVFSFVMPFIYPFASSARRALREYYGVIGMPSSGLRFHINAFSHFLGFAWSVMDKTDACSLRRNLPSVRFRDDEGSKAFRELVESGGGAFVMSSHLGTIEVLPAARGLTARDPFVHAFQQMGHDAIFTKFFASRLDTGKMALHPVEEIGVESAVKMKEAIEGGDLVIMAADRIAASNPGAVFRREFFGRECLWPKGVFVFARLMESPVFFVNCVRVAWNEYEVHVKKASGSSLKNALAEEYCAFLEEETRRHPFEWFNFHRFFSLAEDIP